MAPLFTGIAKNLGGLGFGRLGVSQVVFNSISVVLWGAGGGGTDRDPLYGGGSGGFVSATVPYATYSGETFYIVVGGGGVGGSRPNIPAKTGGFGGGGPSGAGAYENGSGGGASYIRLTNGSGTVLLVAGAGSGGNGYSTGPSATSGPPTTVFLKAGGRGGGPAGEGAAMYDFPGGVGAGGGTQVAGGRAGDGKPPGPPGTAGSFLQGGTGGSAPGGGAGGGGGGGYYGGGGGGASDPTRVAQNGGGGSGYVNPTWTAITNSYSPNPYTAYPHPLAVPGIARGANNTFAGYNGEPGYIVITLEGPSPVSYTYPYTGAAETLVIP
jgi:hypothetical protein